MTHRRTNEMLTVFVVITALFILVTPLLPNLDYWWNGQRSPVTPVYARAVVEGETPPPGTVPKDNRIVIPKIGADAPIYEGATESVLAKGPWLRPNTNSPDKGGNTVIAGHRFSYNPGVYQPFYHLDKLGIGDKIVIAWQGKAYTYSVTEKTTVNATQTSIERPTDQTKLTLYTCTPLWNPVNRLVVIATPDSGAL